MVRDSRTGIGYSLTRGSVRGIRTRRLLGGHGSLLGLFVLDLRLVMTNDATGSRAGDGVMSCDMPDDGAHGGTLDAPFGTTDARAYCDCGYGRRGEQ